MGGFADLQAVYPGGRMRAVMTRAGLLLLAAALAQETVGVDQIRVGHRSMLSTGILGSGQWRPNPILAWASDESDSLTAVGPTHRTANSPAWVPLLAGAGMNSGRRRPDCSLSTPLKCGKRSLFGTRRTGVAGIAMNTPEAAAPMGLESLETRLQQEIKKFVKGIKPARPMAWKETPESEELFQVNEVGEDKEYCYLPSPEGLARQEAREEDRGMCKINRYNPDVLRPESAFDYAATAGRLVEVLTAVSSYSALYAFNFYGKSIKEGDPRVKALAADLRQRLIALGPAFIKVGQVLANRPDIVRADYMEELTKLQDKVPPFTSERAFAIMEEELGRPVEEVFADMTPEPVAAASLGQVYKATLRSNGATVAVKVQRPAVATVIKRDVYLMRQISKVFNDVAIQRMGVDAVTLLDEFAENLLEELDYRQEARNIQDFQNNFKDDPLVKIPEAYPEVSTERVLVMEWIDGVRCTDLDKLSDIGVPVQDFIRVGVQSGMRQLLEFGLFHGDPHPGNVFALADGRIAYVDFGSVAEISQTNKEAILDAVVEAMDQNFVQMARYMSKLGFIAEGSDVRPIAQAIEGMWEDAVGRDMQNFNFRTVTTQFSTLAYRYPIRVPERFALVIRTLLTQNKARRRGVTACGAQEGICLTLDPDFKLLAVAYPYVAKRLLRDPLYCNRLRQVLLKQVPEVKKPVFDFRRLFSLIVVAAAVAGSGPKAVYEIGRTVVDGVALCWRRPEIALELAQGVVRWARAKAVAASNAVLGKALAVVRQVLRRPKAEA